MDDEWDSDPRRPRARPKDQGGITGLIVIMVLAAAGGALWWGWDDIDRLFESGRPRPVQDAAVFAPDAGTLALAEGDERLRKLAASASSSPLVASWVAVPDIIQRLTAAVRLIAAGDSPRPVLAFIELPGEFAVREQIETGGKRKSRAPRKAGRGRRRRVEYTERIFIAPASYARYDALVDAFAGLDMTVAGRAYGQLRPYVDAAFAEVAHQGEHFDPVLIAALDRLLSVEVPEGEIELVPKGAIYAFKDPALESRSAAEKHVLRLGPRNARSFQRALRRFADAAGLKLTGKVPQRPGAATALPSTATLAPAASPRP